MGFFTDTKSTKAPVLQSRLPEGETINTNPFPKPKKSFGGFFSQMKQEFSEQAKPFNREEGKARSTLARETVKGIPQAFAELGQESLRASAGVGGFFSRALGGKPLTPTGTFQQELFGTDKPITLSSVGEDLGIPEGSKFAAPVGFALGTADLFSGGTASRVTRTVAKLKNSDEIVKFLKESVPALKSSQHTEALGRALKDVTDTGEIQKQIDSALSMVGPTTKGAARTAGTGEEVVYMTRTGGDNQSVSQTRAGAEEFGDNVEAVVVKSSDVRKTGFVDKDNAGIRNVQRSSIDNAAQATSEAERKFITSAKNVQPENTKLAGQYVPRSTDDLAIKAKNLIRSDPVAAERIAMNESGENAVAIASELMKKYADEAANTTDELQRLTLFDKSAEIANTIAPKLTELGRSIQAASILGRMTPEGQLRFASRQIQKFNEANPLKKIPELTGEDAKFISDEMRAINNMPDSTEKAMRFQKLQDRVTDLVPTPTMQKVITAWKAGLLTGIKTQGLNIFSNAFHGLSEIAKDVPAAVVDRAVSLFTGERKKVLTARKAFDGVKEGAVKGVRYFATGFDERNIGEKLDYTRVNFGNGPVGKAFNAYTGVVFRSLGAGDQVFYYAALSRSMMDQALAEGMNQGLKGKKLVENAYKLVEDPTEEMIRYGVADATTSVFQNKTVLGAVASKIQKSSSITQIILPFARTPSAVVMQVLNYSPIGIAKTIIENAGKGKFDQRMFSQGIGRGLTGTGVIAIGMELTKNNLIAEDFARGDERQQELDKAEGRTPNSIKVDGKWISPVALGPLGNLLLVGGHIQRGIDSDGSPTEAAGTAAVKIAKSFTEQTFLTGVKNFVDGVSNSESFATQYLSNLIASGVPTIVSDVARSTDSKERLSSGVVESVQKRIPGARQTLEPQVTTFGEERGLPTDPLSMMLNPLRPSNETATPVTKELRRLHEAGFKVSPTKVGKKKGYEVLSGEENTELWKLTGSMVNAKITLLMQLPAYQDLTDEARKKAIDTIVGRSKDYGRAAYVLKLTEGLDGQALTDRLLELKEGKLLTRDVLRAYLQLR